MPYDDDPCRDPALLKAELISVYAQLDHLSAIARALYVGIAMIVASLEELPKIPGVSPVHREQMLLALREAKQALRMAENDTAL